jgi:Zn-finger nucleic acid-binding protein
MTHCPICQVDVEGPYHEIEPNGVRVAKCPRCYNALLPQVEVRALAPTEAASCKADPAAPLRATRATFNPPNGAPQIAAGTEITIYGVAEDAAGMRSEIEAAVESTSDLFAAAVQQRLDAGDGQLLVSDAGTGKGTVSPVTAVTLVDAARARLAEVTAELERLEALQREAELLRRLVAVADNVVPIAKEQAK